MPNTLTSIEIEGFRSIRSQRVELRDLNVLIGANGAGKSNLLAVLRVLSFIGREGLSAFIGRSGGANELLHMGARRTPVLRLCAEFRADSGHDAWRASLAHAAGDTLIFTDEEVGHRSEGADGYGWVSLGSGHKESKLRLASLDGDLTARRVRQSVQGVGWYHFHDTSAEARVRGLGRTNDDRYLRSDAGNLAAWLHRLSSSHPKQLARIEGTIRQIAPYFGGFDLEPSRHNPEFIALEWQDRRSDHHFRASALSDGTLRSMALVAMLLQPPDEMPTLIAVDEPELGLHPFAMSLIAGLFEGAATASQLVLSTQSTRLLDCFDPADVIVVDRQQGASVFQRLDTDEYAEWLSEYSVSQLWEKNVVGGGPNL